MDRHRMSSGDLPQHLELDALPVNLNAMQSAGQHQRLWACAKTAASMVSPSSGRFQATVLPNCAAIRRALGVCEKALVLRSSQAETWVNTTRSVCGWVSSMEALTVTIIACNKPIKWSGHSKRFFRRRGVGGR